MSRPRGLPLESLHRLEDLRWMADTGECAAGAARRLGMSRKALETWCNRNAPDLWRRLIDRDPRDVNRNRGNQWRVAS